MAHLTNLAALAALTFAAPACYVYGDAGPGPAPAPAPAPVNAAPRVEWADAGCYYDAYYRDDIWFFQADATDQDGVLDVVAVYADVYDARGDWADSFELYPTEDPVTWFSDWLGSSTWLACGYEGYQVDMVAYDSFDAYDVMTIIPTIDGW